MLFPSALQIAETKLLRSKKPGPAMAGLPWHSSSSRIYYFDREGPTDVALPSCYRHELWICSAEGKGRCPQKSSLHTVAR